MPPIYKFKRYEDSSLSYTGINRHEGEKVGLFNTALDYDEMFVEQQASTEAPPTDESDVPEQPYEFLAADDEGEEKEEKPAPIRKKEKKSKKYSEVVIIRPASKAASPSTDYHDNKEKYKIQTKPAETLKSAAQIEYKPKPVETAHPEFDESAIQAGTKVFHKGFGSGIVETAGNKRLTVSFGDIEKTFMFPDAFLQGFLKVEE